MRIVVISDIHGNRTAIEAVLSAAGRVDEIWCLGDVVGYGPEPGWCADRIVGLGAAASLSGRHDLAAFGKLECSGFNYAARVATIWTSNQLSTGQRHYLGSLPSSCEARGTTLAHGSPRAPVWEFVGDSVTADLNLDLLSTECGFVDHTHAPAVSERVDDRPMATHTRWQPDQPISLANRRLLLNLGSVGQPRDGDPRASFALYDIDSRNVALHRTPYNVEAVQARMRRIGLLAHLADRLAVRS